MMNMTFQNVLRKALGLIAQKGLMTEYESLLTKEELYLFHNIFPFDIPLISSGIVADPRFKRESIESFEKLDSYEKLILQNFLSTTKVEYEKLYSNIESKLQIEFDEQRFIVAWESLIQRGLIKYNLNLTRKGFNVLKSL